jgi:ATP-binding cassette, subfamily F, member 3
MKLHIIIILISLHVVASFNRLPPSRIRMKFSMSQRVDEKVNTQSALSKLSSMNPSVKYSGSSGAAIQISNVDISIGNNDILKGINWTILPNERWAIVGRNGEGKSTLLKAITCTGGETLSISNGEICIAKKYRIGFLEQKGVSGSTLSVREEVTSRMDRLVAATAALEEAETLVSNGDTSDETLTMLSDATVEFEAAGGYDIEKKIANVLNGLGFLQEDWDRKCSEFSGGWQMRIALARLLLSEPDLLMLDEPTNHLDKGARDWLGSYLSRYDGTLVIVSHDENLLRSAVNSIAEIKNGVMELYKSRSYDQWQIERDERVKAAVTQYEANQREIARLQGFVDRFGAKTMGASLAQSKLKTIEKLEAATPEAPIVSDGPVPKLRLPNPPRGSKKLLEIRDGVVAWPNDDGDLSTAAPIIRDFSISIERGMKIAVRGPNGAGKSTLFKALSGLLPLQKGSRIEGDG